MQRPTAGSPRTEPRAPRATRTPRTPRTPLAVALVTLLALAGVVTACSSSGTTGTGSTYAPPPRPFGVGITSATFVDASRPTQANRDQPARSDRTLFTTIVYPSSNPARTDPVGGSPVATNDAPADTAHGPFPLIVFAHGFGGNEQLLLPLATRWAQAGYVVALPRFPLTTTAAPGGINGADIANQPADVGFLFSTLAAPNDTPVNGIVDGDRLALAGHSNGGITTLGAIANSCCKDRRIDAAIVFAGVTSPFGGGTYDLSDLPPVMFVHGVNDAQIDFDQAARIFNDAAAPKAMLRVDTGDHVSILVPTAPTFATVAAATIDFLDWTLLGDPQAANRLATEQVPEVTTMFLATDSASAATVKVPVQERPATARTATISKQDGLRDGERITVTWSGFLPGKTVNIVQCTGDGTGGSETCEIRPGQVLIPDPTGAGQLEMAVIVGKVGNGVCDASNPCTILVNDSGLQDPAAFVYFPITFAR